MTDPIKTLKEIREYLTKKPEVELTTGELHILKMLNEGPVSVGMHEVRITHVGSVPSKARPGMLSIRYTLTVVGNDPDAGKEISYNVGEGPEAEWKAKALLSKLPPLEVQVANIDVGRHTYAEVTDVCSTEPRCPTCGGLLTCEACEE